MTPNGGGGKCQQNSADNNWNPEQEQAGEHQKCDACDQPKKQQAEHDRRRTRLFDNNASYAMMLIDLHPHSRHLAPRMGIKARWDDFRLRAGLFWRSIAHRHEIVWVVQRHKAMHDFAPPLAAPAEPGRRLEKGELVDIGSWCHSDAFHYPRKRMAVCLRSPASARAVN